MTYIHTLQGLVLPVAASNVQALTRAEATSCVGD